MKILFKNITKYDEDIYKEFLKFHQKKFGFKYSLYTAFIIGLLIILVAIQIHIHNMDLAIIICFAILGFFLWRYIRPAFKVSKELNSEKIQKQKAFLFLFYDKKFKICENNKLERYVFTYTHLYKIFETKDFFYLYVDKSHSILVNKNTFFIGNSIEFSEFLKKKCKYKYKKMNLNKLEQQ